MGTGRINVLKEWIGKRGEQHKVTNSDVEQHMKEVFADENGVKPEDVTILGVRPENSYRKGVYSRLDKTKSHRTPGTLVVDYSIKR